MKRFLISLCIILLSFSLSGQVTYYYKLSSVVTDGIKKEANNSGLFITFTNSGCYDSDNEEYTMNNGFLSYIGKNENTIAYKGESYWGKAEYFFSSNHELLNVKLLNGTIYVYRKAVPGSQTKSTYVGDRNSDSSGKTDGTVVPSINIYNIDRYDLKNDDRENFKVDEYFTCPACNGSKKCSSCAGRGENIYNGIRYDCDMCHGTGTCYYCHGRGKVR